MSHTIYRTLGYVMNSRPFGEANMRLDLLTEDLGVVSAGAQGIRLLKSKLRYSLSDFSLAEISLVRTAESWRIVNALKKDDLFSSLDAPKRFIFIKAFSLIRRFVQGEESNPPLYQVIFSGHEFINRREYGEEELFGIECVLILSILFHLGYVADVELLNQIHKGNQWTDEFLKESVIRKNDMVVLINKALRESGL